MRRVYLDYNASTPLATEVVEAMRPYLTDHYGNPSSQHWAAAEAREAVDKARAQVASLLSCESEEIVFTSGGTEANNHAIKGAFWSSRDRGNHIITSAVEHPATINPCRFLETLGAQVTVVPVDGFGRVDPDDVRKALTSKTVLVSIMHANNEVGTIQPIEDISKITRQAAVLFHTDAAQSIGKIAAANLGVDLLSIAGHKVYAPKGVGALYIRRGIRIEPFMHGAGHEGGRRAGTENVILNAGLGAACEAARGWIGMPKVRELRDKFWQMLQDSFGSRVELNGHPTHRLPNTLNVSFRSYAGSEILEKIPDLAASTGSACHAGSVELSPVLKAMGVKPSSGMGAIRFSLGRFTSLDEIMYVVKCLREVIS